MDHGINRFELYFSTKTTLRISRDLKSQVVWRSIQKNPAKNRVKSLSCLGGEGKFLSSLRVDRRDVNPRNKHRDMSRACPRHPQTTKWKEFLHQVLVQGLGYVPGVFCKSLRYIISVELHGSSIEPRKYRLVKKEIPASHWPIMFLITKGSITQRMHGTGIYTSMNGWFLYPPSNSPGSLVVPDSIGNSVYHIGSLKMHPL